MHVLGIKFAPLWIPLERRLQTLAVAIHVWSFLFMGVTSVLILYLLLFTPFFWITLIYAYWYWLDWDQSSRGGRRLQFMRQLPLWKWYRDYFPIKLVKTANLDPRHKYIFGAHPHGIMGCGYWNAFATEFNGFSQLFPGIDVHLLGMKLMFQFPLYREYVMSLGLCDVSRKSIDYWMGQKPGTAVAIVVGGAKEASQDDKEDVRLVLKSRKGFVKLAIIHGAHLVPVFSFGENDLYQIHHTPEHSWVGRLQKFIHKNTRVSPVLFSGRGIFNYTLGLLPHRRPITVVVGAPVSTEMNPNPTQEEIDFVHQRYLDEMRHLFDTNKALYGCSNARLSYID